MSSRSSKSLLAAALVACQLLIGAIAPAYAARPSATQLLPVETIAAIRIPNVQELHTRFMETGTGRMTQDPQLQPVVRSLYGVLANAFAEADKQFEMSLDELLSIPQGEIAVGFVAPEERRPAVVFFLDVGDNMPVAQRLLDRGKQLLEDNGSTKSEELVNDVKITVYQKGDDPPVAYLEREGTIVIATDLEVAKGVLERWNGGSGQTLADNFKFAAISKSNRSTGDESHFSWFVDPIAIAKAVSRDNAGAQIALAVLPTLGLDGLQGIGGSMTFSVGEFDAVSHVHVLLDEPRAGVIEMLAMGSGDSTPERWVPADTINYTTLHWNFQKTFDKLASLVDSFQGQGEFYRQLKRNVSERIGADIETEIIPALDGRVTHLNIIERPITINSNGTLVGIKLKDPKAFASVLEKVVARFPDFFEKRTFGGITYFASKNALPNPDENATKLYAAIGIVEGYLMGADRTSMIEKAISAQHSGEKSLADALDYKLIASKLSRQSGGVKPGMINFNRPDESLRFLYDLATAERSKQGLQQWGERNPFFKSLNQSLEQNPLPPFEVLARYFAPGGGMMVNDETGFHWTSFSLKRK